MICLAFRRAGGSERKWAWFQSKVGVAPSGVARIILYYRVFACAFFMRNIQRTIYKRYCF